MYRKYLTTGRIAKICNVSPRGVVQWIETGNLVSFRTPGGQRRILEKDFKKFLKFNKIKIDKSLWPIYNLLLIGDLGLFSSFVKEKYEGQVTFESCDQISEVMPMLQTLYQDAVFISQDQKPDQIQQMIHLIEEQGDIEDIPIIMVIDEDTIIDRNQYPDMIYLSLSESNILEFVENLYLI